MRWALWSVLSPSQLLVLLAILGPLAWAAGAARWGRRITVASALGLFVFGVLPSSHYMISRLERQFPQPSLPREVAGIVLLAGAKRPVDTELYGEPQLNPHGSRYLTLLRLANRYPQARIAWVGGPEREARDGVAAQGLVARSLLSSTGLAPARVVYEPRSTDTCDSAKNARALLRPGPGENWVLVTSALHLPRAMGCFRAAGWEVVPSQPTTRSCSATGT